MADWTLISTTLGAAAIAGGSGYLVARQGAKVSIRQVEAEAQRTREQIEAENERLRAQHQQDHLRNRQGAYHDFLNAKRRFSRLVMRGEATQDDFLEFNDVANGPALFGTVRVARAAAALATEYGAVFGAAAEAKGEHTGDAEHVIAEYGRRSSAIDARRITLLNEMRADIAPEEPG